MGDSLRSRLLDPLVLTIITISVGLFFVSQKLVEPLLPLLSAIALSAIEWILAAYRLIDVRQMTNLIGKGLRAETKNIEIHREDRDKDNCILQFEFTVSLKSGEFWYRKMYRKIWIAISYDEEFVIMVPTAIYPTLEEKEGQFLLPICREKKHEGFELRFLLVTGPLAEKASGMITSTLIYKGKSSIWSTMWIRLLLRRAKRLLYPVQIDIRK
jgi:hypothetical protein